MVKKGADGEDLPDDMSTASSIMPESISSKDGSSLNSNFLGNAKVASFKAGGAKKDDVAAGEGNKNICLDPYYAAQMLEKFVLDVIMMVRLSLNVLNHDIFQNNYDYSFRIGTAFRGKRRK